MNKIIYWFNDVAFSVWDGISISAFATILLYGFVACIGFWVLNKSKTAFKVSLLMLLCFIALTGYTKWQTSNQQKLIVYNVPQHQAIDFINGNTYKFIGDSVLLKEGMLQNFHLKPGRVDLQLKEKVDSIPALNESDYIIRFGKKKILLIDESVVFEPMDEKINIDYVIISKNPKLYIPQLAKVFNVKQFIFDGSNSLWKIAKWKTDCEQLNLPCYSVPEQGAFVLDL